MSGNQLGLGVDTRAFKLIWGEAARDARPCLGGECINSCLRPILGSAQKLNQVNSVGEYYSSR